LKIVDTSVKPINVMNVLTPKKISVVDFSDASDPVKNIVIADLLDKVFKQKMENPETPKLFIALEEAHTFISIERREHMMATLVLLLELARRGRKRGICLNIISQQPARLPPELLELCNTRIMHRMSSATNIEVLKQSTGNVPESFWDTLPSLGRGEAIVASPRYTMAVITQIRPVASKRLTTE
jgi:DNA helicase HerA-like ATPase